MVTNTCIVTSPSGRLWLEMSRFQLETAGVPDAKRGRRERPRVTVPNSTSILERRKMFEQTDSAPEKLGKRRLTISGRKGGDVSRSSSFRGSKKLRVEEFSSPALRGRQVSPTALWHRLKYFGHYDLQSMTVDRLLFEKGASVEQGVITNQATGASAAAQAMTKRAPVSCSLSNELVASCPSFRNEIGGDADWTDEGSTMLTLRDCLNHEKQKRVGTREIMVLDGETHGNEGHAPVNRQASSVFEPYSGVHFPFEYIDYGATYYRNYFMGQGDVNAFSCFLLHVDMRVKIVYAMLRSRVVRIHGIYTCVW